MKLTKRKLNQLIREVLTEFDATQWVDPGQAAELKTVDEVKTALQGLLNNWVSQEPDATRYNQELQAVVNRIPAGPGGAIELAGPEEPEEIGYGE